MNDARSHAALTAALAILAMAGFPVRPDQFDFIAATVLDAIYQAEAALADQPARLVCTGCLLSMPLWLGEAARPCPACRGRMFPPGFAGRN